jgi:hypothetical protein
MHLSVVPEAKDIEIFRTLSATHPQYDMLRIIETKEGRIQFICSDDSLIDSERSCTITHNQAEELIEKLRRIL